MSRRDDNLPPRPSRSDIPPDLNNDGRRDWNRFPNTTASTAAHSRHGLSNGTQTWTSKGYHDGGNAPQQRRHDFASHEASNQNAQHFPGRMDMSGEQETEHEESMMNHIASLEAAKEELEKLIDQETKKKDEERRLRYMMNAENIRLKRRNEELEASKSNEPATGEMTAHVEKLEALLQEQESMVKRERETAEGERKQRMVLEQENADLKRKCTELESKVAIAKVNATKKTQASTPADAGATKSAPHETELTQQVRDLTSEVATHKTLSEDYKGKYIYWQQEYKNAEAAIREWREMGDLALLQRFMKEKNITNNIRSTDDVHEHNRNSRFESQQQPRYLKSVANMHDHHAIQHQQHVSQQTALNVAFQQEKREMTEKLERAQRRSKDLQANCALLRAERDQAVRELDDVKVSLKETKRRLTESKQTAEECKNHHQSLEATLLKTQHDLKVNLEARTESEYAVSCLRSEVEGLQRDLGSATLAKERAAGQRDVAQEERSKLFRLLQGATVKRTDAPKSGNPDGFPTGGQIERFTTKTREGETDLFHSIRDTMIESSDYSWAKEVTESYRITLDFIICSAWSTAVAWVESYERNKLEELSHFLNQMPVEELLKKVETENTLLHLFWVYSMQETARLFPKTRKELMEGLSRFLHDREVHQEQGEAIDGVATEGPPPGTDNQERVDSDVKMEDEADQNGPSTTPVEHADDPTLPFIQWVRRAEVCQALEELEVPTWDSFTVDFILLLLFCKFSDPPCYLWPPAGTPVEFANDYHKIETLPGGPRKPKSGDLVRVLFPGLYYVNPHDTTEDGTPVEPKMKAIVVSFGETSKSDA